MTDRLARLEDAVAAISATVGRLEARIATLEANAGTAPVQPVVPAGKPVPSAEAIDSSEDTVGESFAMVRLTRIVTLVGRTFLVLAGAFLLRAATDAGTLPTSVGVGLGLAYASVWFVAASGAARGRRPASAATHGVSAAMIAYPLIWEATRSFQVLSSSTAVMVVAGISAVGLVLAWRYELRVVAWVITVAAILSSVALMFISPSPVPAAWFLVLLGIATLWIGRARGWPELPWLPAFVADVAVARVVGMASSASAAGQSEPTVGVVPALVLAIILLTGYLGSVAIGVFLRRTSIGAFDVAQTAGVLAAGLGGTIEVAGAGHSGWAGLASVLVAAACYWASFKLVPNTTGSGRDFVYFSTLAMALVLIGTPILVGGLAASVLWGLLAICAAFIGGGHDRITLRAHAAVLTVAAALQSGLVEFEIDALGAGSSGGPWRHPTIWVHIALATAMACLVMVARSRTGSRMRWPLRLPLVVMVAVAAPGLCAEMVSLLAAPWLFDVQTDAGFAMLRTGVMAIGALVLAGSAVRFQLPELGWLVYPALVVLGLKIVLQDLPAGGPLSIAVAFVFYGAALILGPRLLRSTEVSKASSG